MRIHILSAACAALLLSACGGDAGSGQPAVPATPAHAAATVALGVDNAPFIVANAQAVSHTLRWWLDGLTRAIASVGPGQAQNGYLCGGSDQPASVETDYLDADHDGHYSAGDRIVTVSPRCEIMALGGGTTALTALAAGSNEITDANIDVDHTLDNYSLESYAWSQTLHGRFRLTTLSAGQAQLLGIGDVELTLAGGQMLLLRNLAVVYDRTNGMMTDLARLQFDLAFQSGQDAGQQVQVDAEGKLVDGGGNMGPTPGTLMVSGSGATRVRLAGTWANGPHFTTTIDLGNGQFVPESDVDDVAFYAALRQ